MISVVIPLYNKEQQIARTLDTVRAQTFTEYEVVIINDGSKDHSAQVVTEYAATYLDVPLRLIHQENAGVSAARNKGIAEAAYNYIAFLDADDLWDAGYLQTIAELIAAYPSCLVYATAYGFEDFKGNRSPLILNKMPFGPGAQGMLHNYFEVASCSHPPLWSSAVAAKKEALQHIGGFPLGIKSGEDLLTWARLAVNGEIAYYWKPLAFFVQETFNEECRPKRVPDKQDKVGVALKNILKNHNRKDIKGYVALWYKMRSYNYVFLNDYVESIRSISISLSYRFNKVVVLYFILLFLPYSWRASFYKRIKMYIR